jgi:hypothetical protein
VQLPGSKSISNRVLLLAALSEGETRVHDLLDSDDTRVMLAALEQLGCGIERQAGNTVVVQGLGGRLPVRSGALFLGNAGTAMRPLTAALACWRRAGAGSSSSAALRACTNARLATWSMAAPAGLRCGLPGATTATRRCGWGRARPRRCSWTPPSACAATCPASSSPRCCWPCRWWPNATSRSKWWAN